MRYEEVALYEAPAVYDAVVPPGPCERFYRDLARQTGGPVLELACGTGRLSIPLAAEGHEVVGLDASPAMLRAADRKARAAGVDIAFTEGDMRSFALGRAFRLVIVSCNSLAHLITNEDLVSALRCIARHLAPGGLLAFDIVNPQLGELADADAATGAACERHGTAVEELLAYDPIAQVRVLRWQLDGAGPAHRRTESMRLRAIFPQELPLLLNAAGLDLVDRFGDFEGRPLVADSLNQVCIARRTQTPPS